MREARENAPRRAIELLERDTELLTREPTGAGLDPPNWLEALEEEVDLQRRPAHARDDDEALRHMIPQTLLSYDEIMSQLQDWIGELSRSSNAPRFRWSD